MEKATVQPGKQWARLGLTKMETVMNNVSFMLGRSGSWWHRGRGWKANPQADAVRGAHPHAGGGGGASYIPQHGVPSDINRDMYAASAFIQNSFQDTGPHYTLRTALKLGSWYRAAPSGRGGRLRAPHYSRARCWTPKEKQQQHQQQQKVSIRSFFLPKLIRVATVFTLQRPLYTYKLNLDLQQTGR